MNEPALFAMATVLGVPLAAAALLAIPPGYRLTAQLNVLAAFATLTAAASLYFLPRPAPGQYLFLDERNIVFVVLSAFVAFTTSVFSATYIGHGSKPES
jgi:hydrogenase-4 component F